MALAGSGSFAIFPLCNSGNVRDNIFLMLGIGQEFNKYLIQWNNDTEICGSILGESLGPELSVWKP